MCIKGAHNRQKWEISFRLCHVSSRLDSHVPNGYLRGPVFDTIVQTFRESYFPLRTVRSHSKDKPWIASEFKTLIARRQAALMKGNDDQEYRRIRNIINRRCGTLHRRFFNQKKTQLTDNESKNWWRHVKNVVDISKQDNTATPDGLANAVAGGDISKLSKEINAFFNKVSADLSPLPTATNRYATQQPNSMYHISVIDVGKGLAKVKPSKAPGPDGNTSWMLRDLSAQLAGPVAALFNSDMDTDMYPNHEKVHILRHC